jgi:hypothetical protein
MDAFGPYVSAKALMEAIDSPFTYGSGEEFAANGWQRFDTLEMTKTPSDKLYWVGRIPQERKNYLLGIARFLTHPTADPEVYVQLMPPGELKPALAKEFSKGYSKEWVPRIIEQAVSMGTPVKRFIIYLVGPKDSVFKDLVALGEKYKNAEGASAGQVVSTAAQKYKTNKQVLGWVEYSVRYDFSDKRYGIIANIDRTGWAVNPQIGVPDRVNPLTLDELGKLGDEIGSVLSIDEAAKLVLHHYVYKAWTRFREFLDDTSHGPKAVVEKAIKASRANLAHTKGIPLPPAPEVKERKAPVYGKVVGSIKSDGGEMPFDVVSADEADHRVLRADGTYYQANRPIDQRELHNVPASSVTPLVNHDEYQAIMGIHYDHPLIKPGMNNQTWWYSDKNLFMSAAKNYALWTGDQPNVVFIATTKRGANKGIRISWQELKTRSDEAAIKFRNELNEVIRRFRNGAAEGQRSFPALMMEKFKFDINKAKRDRPADDSFTGLLDAPRNPSKDDPPGGFDRELWNKYIRNVQDVFKLKLGLNLGAKAYNKLTFDRTDIRKDVAATNIERFSGEKGEKWALFLVQYLLAHGPSQTGASYTYMVPLNIIRSVSADIKPLTLTRVRQEHLKQWLRDNHGKFEFFNKTQDWQFLRANAGMPFPYARLIRPMIVTDKNKLAAINSRLPSNIQMTTTGYILDGVQYDGFTMVVAMPPSAAEKHGLVSRNKIARQILADPNMVYRLRMGVHGKRGSLRDLNLFSTPVALIGAGVAHPDDVHKHDAVLSRARENLASADIFSRAKLAGPDAASQLTPSKLALSLGRRYSPIIKQHLNRAGQVIRISVAGYEASGTGEQRLAKWDEFIENTKRENKDTELLINQILNQMAQASAAMGQRPQGSLENEMHDDVQQFIRYVKMEVGSQGNTIRVPQIVNQLKMSEYTAPIGTHSYRSLVLTMKAPSADVAKLLILYRLLRRSITNRETGKLMAHRAFNQSTHMFPELNAMNLAQWAAAGFPVVKNEDVKGIIFQQRPSKIYKTDWEHARGEKFGEHATARMLRVD